MTETIPQPTTAAAETFETVHPEEGAAPESAKPGLLVLAPLRIEANAVRRGLTRPTSRVLHTGMGATRAKRSAEKGTPRSFFGGVAVMGTAASLSGDLHPGDLVVATEVSDGETTVSLPGAELLAAELRRAGLTARAGRLVTVQKLVKSAARGRLAADGYLAADMEFMLDATVGLIDIQQNKVIYILSIVSVVLTPPVLVASTYGMNFHMMPELEWPWGYPFALALMLASAVGPFLVFKLKGWL